MKVSRGANLSVRDGREKHRADGVLLYTVSLKRYSLTDANPVRPQDLLNTFF